MSLDDFPISFWENLIDQWIRNERDRNILKMRLLDGKTINYIADEFGLSERQVNRIIKTGKNKIFSKV